MKTMLELLIRLQEMRCCCQRALRNPQITNGEKALVCSHKRIVRECLPAEVLVHYDRMKVDEPELLESPELFAMAVLVSTWRNLSLRKRRKLVAHFAPDPRQPDGNPTRRNGKSKIQWKGAQRYKRVADHAVE